MTDGAGLLDAILANPDCDATRLVYADWLQEQGEDARAELIRVQVEKARIPNPPSEPQRGDPPDKTLDMLEALQAWRKQWSPRFYELRARERDILHDYEWDWLHAVCSELHRGSYEPATRTNHWLYPHEWSRGFLSFVTLEAADFLQHADAILTAHPVRKVTLTTLPEVDERLFNPHEMIFSYRLRGRGGWRTMLPLHDVGDAVLPLLKAEWPGIEFELPPEQHRGRVIPVTREAIFNDTGLLARPPG